MKEYLEWRRGKKLWWLDLASTHAKWQRLSTLSRLSSYVSHKRIVRWDSATQRFWHRCFPLERRKIRLFGGLQNDTSQVILTLRSCRAMKADGALFFMRRMRRSGFWGWVLGTAESQRIQDALTEADAHARYDLTLDALSGVRIFASFLQAQLSSLAHSRPFARFTLIT